MIGVLDKNIHSSIRSTGKALKGDLELSAIITLISESSSHYSKVTENANKMPEVIKCYSTTGRGSHLLIVRTKNTGTLEKLLRTIQSWPGVEHTETQIILSSYKEFSTVPITHI